MKIEEIRNKIVLGDEYKNVLKQFINPKISKKLCGSIAERAISITEEDEFPKEQDAFQRYGAWRHGLTIHSICIVDKDARKLRDWLCELYGVPEGEK